MFRARSNGSNGSNTRRHVKTATSSSSTVEEYYGEEDKFSRDKPEKDPEYWQVKLPSDDLDFLMWGDSGVPPPTIPTSSSPPPPEPAAVAEPPADLFPPSQKDLSVSLEATGESISSSSSEESDSDECSTEEVDRSNSSEEEDNEQEKDENEDILSDEQQNEPPAPAPPTLDKIVLEDIAWKQRSGFGKYSIGIIQHEWEQRRVVLYESGILRYYSIPKSNTNMEGVKDDPEPRGLMYIRDHTKEDSEKHSESGSEHGGGNNLQRARSSSFEQHPNQKRGGILRLPSLVSASDKSSNHGGGGIKVQARERKSDPGPTPYEIDITRRDNNVMWRFCFQSQSIQIEWLSTLKSMASDDGESSDDDDGDDGEGLANNHGFQPGDHIIRWEMLPVLYPIQIHGIVLEAGKNCVIVADFGLASYDNRSAGSDDLTTFEEKDDSHDIIMAAWEKIKPKTKRLNVRVVTDRREIRKWSKINYKDQVAKKNDKKGKKKGFFKSLIPWEQKNGKEVDEAIEETGVEGAGDHGSEGDCANDSINDDALAEENGSPMKNIEVTDNYANGNYPDDAIESNAVEGEPEWAQPGHVQRKRTASTSSSTQLTSDGQSVFSIDHQSGAKSELPKSDSAKLVLARTHFILENEDLLPPYHVFHSNSECIAVWCKTGRWSTLQTAVYLVSSSVGFGKSAVMMTLSVAAAHVVLVPALAVGGLAVVGAPMLYLRKSQQLWQEATMRLTEEFWRRASPDVFVEAIEYWGNWGGGSP
mmetsp:Transcript_27245/g.56777  ORF Transcript_27245/g.56777 Transcript_27245/m.56777 type:complete len:756 (+) Transcript_27245:143-2410(+)